MPISSSGYIYIVEVVYNVKPPQYNMTLHYIVALIYDHWLDQIIICDLTNITNII